MICFRSFRLISFFSICLSLFLALVIFLYNFFLPSSVSLFFILFYPKYFIPSINFPSFTFFRFHPRCRISFFPPKFNSSFFFFNSFFFSTVIYSFFSKILFCALFSFLRLIFLFFSFLIHRPFYISIVFTCALFFIYFVFSHMSLFVLFLLLV